MVTPPKVISGITALICCSLLWISSNMFAPTVLISSMINRVKWDSLLLNVFKRLWLRGWKPLYMPLPRRSAEWRIIPDIMKAAAPVGAVSNTITSSGSMVPESPFYTLDSHSPTLMRMLIQKVCTNLLPWRVWYVALLGSCAVAEG